MIWTAVTQPFKALELHSGGPEFSPRPIPKLDLLSVVASSTSSATLVKAKRRQRLWKRYLKSKSALIQTLSSLFHLVQFVKCWQIFLELNSKRLYGSLGKEKESRCLLLTSFTKCEIRYFHVVVVP